MNFEFPFSTLPDVLRGIVPGRQPVGTTQMQKEAGDVRTRERQRRVGEALERVGRRKGGSRMRERGRGEEMI